MVQGLSSGLYHSQARVAIGHVLAGSGFGERACALTQIATLAKLGGFTEARLNACMAAAAQLNFDPAMVVSPAQRHAGLGFSVAPQTVDELCSRLCGVVTRYPADTGLQVTSLWALATLWPHASTTERDDLLHRWFVGLVSRRAPAASTLPLDSLRNWLRNVPTSFTPEPLSASSLLGMLAESDPERAYHVLVGYLGPDTNLQSLSWALGALAEHVLLRQQPDLHGGIMHALSGAAACQALARKAPPEDLAALICQLAHQIWWCSRQGQPGRVQSQRTAANASLASSVRTGDVAGARRAARASLASGGPFWMELQELLDGLIAQHLDWSTPLRALAAIALRGAHHALSSDDAAALGEIFAQSYAASPTASGAPAQT